MRRVPVPAHHGPFMGCEGREGAQTLLFHHISARVSKPLAAPTQPDITDGAGSCWGSLGALPVAKVWLFFPAQPALQQHSYILCWSLNLSWFLYFSLFH